MSESHGGTNDIFNPGVGGYIHGGTGVQWKGFLRYRLDCWRCSRCGFVQSGQSCHLPQNWRFEAQFWEAKENSERGSWGTDYWRYTVQPTMLICRAEWTICLGKLDADLFFWPNFRGQWKGFLWSVDYWRWSRQLMRICTVSGLAKCTIRLQPNWRPTWFWNPILEDQEEQFFLTSSITVSRQIQLPDRTGHDSTWLKAELFWISEWLMMSIAI